MTLTLYGHPFSSYTWKALIPLYENGTPFAFVNVDPANPEAMPRLLQLWPLGKFPVLVDGDRTILESSTLIEHLQIHHPGPVRLIPADADAAIEVRMLDRIFDNHVMGQMQRRVNDSLLPPERRDAALAADVNAQLDKIYAWLDAWLEGREWAAAGQFSLADCAAAPALFYADWVHQIGAEFANLRAYRARLLARPSIARVVDEARPYRHYFPLGAPDRD
jgi:glutathione S-transferase